MNTETQKHVTRKKITAKILKMAELAEGQTVIGLYKGQSERPWFDAQKGEEVMIPQFHFEDNNGVRFNVFGDAGLKNAIASANVKEGMTIEIEKCAQVDLGNGRRVNNCEIYELN